MVSRRTDYRNDQQVLEWPEALTVPLKPNRKAFSDNRITTNPNGVTNRPRQVGDNPASHSDSGSSKRKEAPSDKGARVNLTPLQVEQ